MAEISVLTAKCLAILTKSVQIDSLKVEHFFAISKFHAIFPPQSSSTLPLLPLYVWGLTLYQVSFFLACRLVILYIEMDSLQCEGYVAQCCSVF